MQLHEKLLLLLSRNKKSCCVPPPKHDINYCKANDVHVAGGGLRSTGLVDWRSGSLFHGDSVPTLRGFGDSVKRSSFVDRWKTRPKEKVLERDVGRNGCLKCWGHYRSH